MTENKKNFVDFAFCFGAIEPKRKHRIKRIFRDGQFRKKESVQYDFLCYEIRYEAI